MLLLMLPRLEMIPVNTAGSAGKQHTGEINIGEGADIPSHGSGRDCWPTPRKFRALGRILSRASLHLLPVSRQRRSSRFPSHAYLQKTVFPTPNEDLQLEERVALCSYALLCPPYRTSFRVLPTLVYIVMVMNPAQQPAAIFEMARPCYNVIMF